MNRYEAHVVDATTFEALKLGAAFRNGVVVEGLRDGDTGDHVILTRHDDPENSVFRRVWPPRPGGGRGLAA